MLSLTVRGQFARSWQKQFPIALGVMSELGEPQHAGITPIFRSRDLTILNFVWAPCMSLMPHNHQMFSVVGIYSGREDNVFWRRAGPTIEAAGAKSPGVGEVATLVSDIIHSVLNPISKMTCAIHVYGGDFFNPDEPRSEWDHETLIERPWNIDKVKSLFQEAEARFNATRACICAGEPRTLENDRATLGQPFVNSTVLLTIELLANSVPDKLNFNLLRNSRTFRLTQLSDYSFSQKLWPRNLQETDRKRNAN